MPPMLLDFVVTVGAMVIALIVVDWLRNRRKY